MDQWTKDYDTEFEPLDCQDNCECPIHNKLGSIITAFDNMDYLDTNPEQSDEASMMHLDTYFSGDYRWEVFAIGDRGDDLGHHDDDPTNRRGPLSPRVANGQPQAGTPPLVLNGALVLPSPEYQ